MISIRELKTRYQIEGHGSFSLEFDKKDLGTVIKYTKEVVLGGLASHYGALNFERFGFELKNKTIFFGNYVDYYDREELYSKLLSLYMPKTLHKDDINEWLGYKRFYKNKLKDRLLTLTLSGVKNIYQLRKEGKNETSSSRQKRSDSIRSNN